MRTQYLSRQPLVFMLCACLAIAFIGGMRTDAATPSSLLKDAKVDDKDKALFFGGCDKDPFPFLEKRHKPLSPDNSFVSRTGEGSTKGIDTALACRLMKLIEFAESKNCPVVITSAMRPEQRCKQGGGACSRPGNSCHQYGRAVDISGDSRCLQLVTDVIGRKMSKGNNEFKLHVAYVENANYRHIQCIEHQGANYGDTNGCKTECNGGIGINPDFSKLPGAPAAPSSSLADNFRRALGLEQQPQPQSQPAPQPQPAPAPQPGAVQSGQLFGNQGTNLGTTGSAPTGTAVPVISTPPGSAKSSTTPQSEYEQGSYGPSVTDQLMQLAYDTPLDATSTAVATSVPLTLDGSDVQEVSANASQGASSSIASQAYGAPGTVLPSSNTFVSNDIAGGPYQVIASYRGEPTGFVALLVQLRDAFAALLNILRPMGIRNAISPADEHADEHYESEFDPEADFTKELESANEVEIVVD